MFYYPEIIRNDSKYNTILNQSIAHWLCGKKPNVVENHLNRFFLKYPNNTIVIYAIPNRDIGQYSMGGLKENTYINYIKSIERSLMRNKCNPYVIFEPDAIAHLDKIPDIIDKRKRIVLIQNSIEILKYTNLYLDIGHPRWHSIENLKRLLGPFDLSCIKGFSLNVSSYCPIKECLEYSDKIFDVFNKKTIIDTSRNGNPIWNSSWLNPAGRLLGNLPNRNPHYSVEAFQWIKVPGTSDGKDNINPRAGKLSKVLLDNLLGYSKN